MDSLLTPPVRPGSSSFGCDFCCTTIIKQILVPCMLQTHSTSAVSWSVWPRTGRITQVLQICLNTLRISLISSTKHQFPARQTHFSGEVSQCQQQRKTGKGSCTATSSKTSSWLTSFFCFVFHTMTARASDRTMKT